MQIEYYDHVGCLVLTNSFKNGSRKELKSFQTEINQTPHKFSLQKSLSSLVRKFFRRYSNAEICHYRFKFSMLKVFCQRVSPK